MNTVFSHVVQKRFSKEYEDVATDALAYILQSSEPAQSGFNKLLRGIAPELPALHFRTQRSEGNGRPDMCGVEGAEARVFIENKFWAGLTEHQPVTYLKRLAESSQPTLLLVVVPVARKETVWRELVRRLGSAGVSASSKPVASGITRCVETQLGPVLALTTWSNLLSVIETSLPNDLRARNDLVQLRSLSDVADSQAFKPVSPSQVTDQGTPAFILQLNEIVESAVSCAHAEGVLNKGTLRPQSDSTRVGRYAWLPSQNGAIAWFGVHFELWREHGGTPLWLVFSDDDGVGRASEVRALLEHCAVADDRVLLTTRDDEFAVAIRLETGEERDEVIRSVVNQLDNVGKVLANLNPTNKPK